jgi:DNA-binding CsgD family transcriptional regulator
MAQLSTDEKILQRLEQILRVLAIQVGEDTSLTERVRLLKLAGLDNQTIADVLNTTPESVRALSSNLSKRRARRKTPARRQTDEG